MSMTLNVAKIDCAITKRITTSATATAAVQLQQWSGGSAAPNFGNIAAGNAGARDLAGRGLWLISVQGSVCNILTNAASGGSGVLATNAAPYFAIGWCPMVVEIPPGSWVSVLGTATAGTVDFIRVDAFRD
jgi:hypothetical protein